MMGSKKIFEEFQEHQEMLSRKLQVKEGHIVLNPMPCDSLAEYSIALDSCDTSAKLLGWIRHLLEKTWLEMDMLDRFIAEACDKNKIKIQRGA